MTVLSPAVPTAWNEADFDAFLDRHWSPACRVAAAVSGDRSAAEDVVQDSLVRLLRSARRRSPRDVRSFFYRIVTNAARNHRRDTSRRLSGEASARARDRKSVGEEFERAEWVRTRLAELDVDVRAALTLRFLEGLTFKQVAEVLECPEGTAASRVRRGLEALRTQEGDDEESEARALLVCAFPLGGARPRAAELLARTGTPLPLIPFAFVALLLLSAGVVLALNSSEGQPVASAPAPTVGADPQPPPLRTEAPRLVRPSAKPSAVDASGVALPSKQDDERESSAVARRPVVRGRVLRAEDGAPLAGASVSVGLGGGAARGTTGEDGSFAVELPEPVSIAFGGFTLPLRPGERIPTHVGRKDGQGPSVVLSASAEGRQTIWSELGSDLEGLGPVDLRLAAGGLALTVALEYADGRPAEGYRVGGFQELQSFGGETDARGELHATGLRDGWIHFQVDRPDGHRQFDAVLARGSSVRRVIRLPAVCVARVEVVDRLGQPQRGHLLVLDGLGGGASEIDGQATLNALPQSRFAFAYDRERLYAGVFDAEPQSASSGEVRLVAARPTVGCALKGVAVGPPGELDVQLVAEEAAGQPWSRTLVSPVIGGEFAFEGLPAGRYVLYATALRPLAGGIQTVEGRTLVDLSEPGQAVTLTYRALDVPTRSVRLRVVDETQRALSGVRVMAVQDSVTGETDREGAVTLPLPVERTCVRFDAPGRALTYAFAEAGAAAKTVVLPRLAVHGVTVEVSPTAAEAPASVHAMLRAPSGEVYGWTEAAVQSGRAEFVLPGASGAQLILRAPGWAPLTTAIPNAGPVLYRQSIGLVVRGRVTLEGGHPAVNATIALIRPEGRAHSFEFRSTGSDRVSLTRADAEGRFLLSGMAAGDVLDLRLGLRSARTELPEAGDLSVELR